MKPLVVAVALFWVTATFAWANPTSVPAPGLDQIASQISGQKTEVRCWQEVGDTDADPDAWGYVYLYMPVVYLSPKACAGALALQSGAMVPLWQLGLGALTLTHESYHLKTALSFLRRASEAQTECRAIKHVRQTMLDLGASPELADAVLPWSLAIHFKITSFAPEYDWPGCRVPVFSEFW